MTITHIVSPPEEYLACIDLSCNDISVVSGNVRKACLDSGFFYIIKHGIEQSLIDEVFIQSKKFFTLSKGNKMKSFRDEKNRGYTPFEDETLDPQGQTKGDCKEGFYIGPEIASTDLLSSKPFHGPNQWPSSGESRFVAWVERDNGRILLPSSGCWKEGCEFASPFPQFGIWFFRKAWNDGLPHGLSSPPSLFSSSAGEVSNPDAGIFGAGAHSDYGMITMLITNGVPGLQICRKKDCKPQVWEDVEPIKGALIINLGDMLERWSNGIFRSTLHRVVVHERERYSVAFFLDPNFDCLVDCLPACFSDTNPPKFPPITSGEYLLERYCATYKSICLKL